MRAPVVALVLLAVMTACSSAGVDAGPASSTASPSPSPVEAAPTPEPTPSPTPTPAPTPDPAVLAARAALVARLEQALAAVPEGAAVGLAVLDADGAVVFERDGRVPLLPASTAKLLPGAAALHVLGPTATLPTTVEAVGARTRDGVLRGQLVLVGGGDPALDDLDYRSLVFTGRPHTPMEDLADAVAATGLRRVTGGLVAGPDLFGDTPEAPGWKEEYLAVLDARRIRGLTVNAGLAVTVLKQPPQPELELLAAVDPTVTAVETFARMLTERGVRLGTASVGTDDAAPTELAAIASPSVRELVRFAFERSDNQTADTLLRLVGARRGATDWVGAGAAVTDVLAELGVDTTGMVLHDGSGLSRDDRVTPLQLASVDRLMRAGEHAEVWRDALALAGSEGTLRRRLRGTVAEGRFLGKTGTLDDVTAIVGTVEQPSGAAAYHVAAIANVGPGVGRFGSLVVFDDVIALLAEEAAGCVRVAPTAPPSSGEVVPGGLHVDCPTP